MRIKTFLTAVAVIGMTSACGDDDPTGPPQLIYRATLNGAGERPAITTNGTGLFNGVITDGGFLVYTISWSGLSAASNNGHFHGPIVSATAPAGVLIDLNAPTATPSRTITHGTTGSAAGTIDLKVALNANVSADSLRKLLDNNGLYINIHTSTNPGGEIAGVIQKLAQ